jgi:hypothetical protein
MQPRHLVLAVVVLLIGTAVAAPQPAARFDSAERAAVLALITAVDAAQAADAPAAFAWDHHVLKSVDATAFVPFRVTAPDALRGSKSTVMYVRAVSRHDGIPSREERSFVRDWLMNKANEPPIRRETVFIGAGEMPVGGPAAASGRASTQAAAEASARLTMQQRMYEKEKAAAEAARKKDEVKERDPYRFPFEDYYMVAGGSIERALALPAGEYDVYVALVDRAHLKNSAPAVAKRTLTIPDFWTDQLSLSSLILASEVRTLPAPLSRQEQSSHPYTFGHAQVVPVAAPQFQQRDALSIVYQICNYGAPDSDLAANYTFYRVDGGRTLFNRTAPQFLGDGDLPAPSNVWDTSAFTMQVVPLASFPPGGYEVEVSVRDNHTRETATRTAAFTVKP